MKKRDKTEFHGMKAAELTKKAAELKKQIVGEKLNLVTKEVKNRRVVKELKRKYAVILSILRVKELLKESE